METERTKPDVNAFVLAARNLLLRQSSEEWRRRIRLHTQLFPINAIDVKIAEDRIIIYSDRLKPDDIMGL